MKRRPTQRIRSWSLSNPTAGGRWSPAPRAASSISMFASRARARRSSLPSDLFAAGLTSPAMAEAASGRAWLAALLEVEAALAEAGSAAGLVPADAAAAIRGACQPDRFDIERIGAEAV